MCIRDRFKSVRNTVIEEAMNIVMRNALTNETLGDELPDPDYYITDVYKRQDFTNAMVNIRAKSSNTSDS